MHFLFYFIAFKNSEPEIKLILHIQVFCSFCQLGAVIERKKKKKKAEGPQS